MPTAALDRLNLNYRLEGDGPETVVLVNGLADDLETWADQVPALLEAGYRVLRFDNRGIGLSDKPVGPYTTAMFAADTKALVDHLQISDFHLLGVSMGGMIAQEYALAYPADLRSVTLACTYAAPGPFCSTDVRPVGGHGQRHGSAGGDARRDSVGVHARVLRDASGRRWRSSRQPCGSSTSRSRPIWPS